MSYKKTTPADTVLKHLVEEVGIYRLESGARLPTTSEIAARIGVSQGTVKNVYRRFANEGKVQMRKGDGTFWHGQATKARQSYLIGVDRDSLDTPGDLKRNNRWSYLLAGGLLAEKLADTRDIQLKLCGQIDQDANGTLLNQGNFIGLDGMLLLQPNPHPGTTSHLLVEGQPIPVISLNPQQEDSYSNHVSPDYFASSYKLGTIWRTVRKKRILALMSPSIERSITVRLRYGGLMSGLRPSGPQAAETRLMETPNGAMLQGYNAVNRLLNEERWVPDAIYTAGDHLAFGAIQALQEHGFTIPGDISVVGGNGADCLARPPLVLSCIEQSLEQLGRMMLRMILQRIDQSGKDVVAHVEPSRFIIGNTTTPEENQLLHETVEGADNRKSSGYSECSFS